VIKIAGYKILLLKFCSLIFLLLQIWVYYKAFWGRVPNFILFCGLLVIPFNAYILAYGSATFTESFFMLIQALCFLSFFRLLDRLALPDVTIGNAWKYWLLFGFCFFLLSITKNITILAPGIVALYFLIRKEWKYALFALLAFAVFRVPYQFGAQAVYGNISSSQTERLLQKDAFDATKGKADASDFVDRFFGNYGQYITLHTFKMLGLRESGVPSLYTIEKVKESEDRIQKAAMDFVKENNRQPNNDELIEAEFNSRHSWGYTLIFLLLSGLALYHSYRKNKFIFFVLLYTYGLCALTFVGIQTDWNQDRYMVIFLPLFFSIFLYGLYAQGRQKGWKALQPVVVVVGVICLIVQLSTTVSTSSKKTKYTRKYLSGDLYAGLVPGHMNYAKMAQYIGKSIPDKAKILASKPEEAFAYSEKLQFTRVPSKTDNADSLSAFFKKTNTRYILITMPTANGDDRTLYKTVTPMQTFMQKYPARIKEVHSEGDIDQAVLYQILD
jgi:hypothetical protein